MAKNHVYKAETDCNPPMELNYEYFPLPSDEMPQPGDCLIAQPLIAESVFSRSVVLILDRDDSGGFLGLTLNKPSQLHIADIISGSKVGREIAVWRGGPVDYNRLFIIHSDRSAITDSQHIGSELYIGGTLDDIEILHTRKSDFRCFIGYSGWAPGQLEHEISEGTWAVMHGIPTNPLKGGGNEYWRQAVAQLGEAYRSWLIVPRSPGFN